MDDSLISAKSESAELRYRTETARLSCVRKTEVARQEQVKRAEAALWKEISRSASGAPQVGGADRPFVAHRALAEARHLHGEALTVVRHQSTATQRAEAVRDEALQMLLAFRRKESAMQDSRINEEATEVALIAKALCSRAQREDAALDSFGFGDSRRALPPGLPQLPLPAAVRPTVSEAISSSAAEIGSGIPILQAPVMIEAALASSADGTPALSVLCRGQAGAPSVGLMLRRSGAEGLSVVVRAATPEMVAALVRDRAALTHTLHVAGIDVKNVEVQVGAPEDHSVHAGQPTALLTSMRRRSRRGGEDEARVA